MKTKITRGIAIENWPSNKEIQVLKWMRETFGTTSKKTWYVDHDYDLVNLIMSDEIYTMYTLKWSK